MEYAEVAVRSATGDKSVFTYSSTKPLAIGDMVSVPLRGRNLLGIVLKKISKPSFATLEVTSNTNFRLPPPLIKLANWMSAYYGCSLGTSLQLILPPKIVSSSRPVAATTPLPVRHSLKGAALTNEQANALETITSSKQTSFLLHGETGSGKTRVYGELAKLRLEQGRSAMILVPEIGMTPQIAADLQQQLGAQPLVLHSELTAAQRRRIWEELATNSSPRVIVGTRSALFLPIQALGLVVIDEAQDTSYKHEGSPRFHAVRVASQLANLHDATFVLGSATPSVVDYSVAEQKNVPILRMSKPAANRERTVETIVVDRRERVEFSRSPLLSNTAIERLEQTLAEAQQSFVFLNRRGSSKLCICQQCGWVAECNYCQLPLTYHQSVQKLLCHSCGRNYPIHVQCPMCGATELSYQAPGVQALSSELHRLLPNASIVRIDSDTSKADGLRAHYQDLYDGKINILAGTQSIAKGLDLPHLKLGIIVDADSGLHMPDYLAGERMFQLLYQVMGRLGRHQDGTCIVQTLDPKSPIMQAAVERDYQGLYQLELAARQLLNYPPFTHLARIVIEHTDEMKASKISQGLAQKLSGDGVTVAGPSPCFYAKLRGKYRWQLIARSPDRKALLSLATTLPKQAWFDPDPTNLL